MKLPKRYDSLIKYGFIFLIIVYVILNYINKQEDLHTIEFDPSFSSSAGKSIREKALETFSVAYNGTHLWSMHLADDEYYRIAQMTPCRTVTYTTYNTTLLKNEDMNFCDSSTKKEFSVESTLQIQQWIYEHQNPIDCRNKKFAIIDQYAISGFGSTFHQILWAFSTALGDNRIAIYANPGGWLYAGCKFGNPDCYFLPLSNCSISPTVDGNIVIRIKADIDHWYQPAFPRMFRNRSYNWYRSQLLFYLMRFNPKTLAYIEEKISQTFNPPSISFHRPFIALYVRRSDKVNVEMSQAYSISNYIDLFHQDAQRANIKTLFLNSEDGIVFKEFDDTNKNLNNYYKLLSINVTKNIVYTSFFSMSTDDRKKIVLEFLTDLFVETNANLHVGTLTSNWCRLVDEIRFALGKTITFYTPENRYIIDI